MLRKICNALLESSRNHNLTTKHLRITVGEYTYGLPSFLLGATGHGIQPIKYRMLKRMDSFNLLRANLWFSVYQNNIPEVSFKLLGNISKDILNYDQASYNYYCQAKFSIIFYVVFIKRQDYV
ncbi:MAG: hypothetical protein ABJB76_02865 [Candidatus Nitrosocosmicus sp.]